MSEVRFYHLTRQSLEDVLPLMLARTLDRGQRAIVMARSSERVEALAARLWDYDDHAFLPHGTKADGHAALQPVWLTDADENPNGAATLFLTEGASSSRIEAFTLVCELFDGADEGAVNAARQRWRVYQAAGHALTYWQQDAGGSWAQRAGG
ncbi:MAG: DNA polymerase III subunit chi [Alphaproteobacteria bacterium]|nr:DNA polymerase III subunit chi [Alphaproteobacteria bacterium]